MFFLEHAAVTIRHSTWLKDTDWLWDSLRPYYEKTLILFSRTGLQRVINGTDRIMIPVELRTVIEIYEPPMWGHLMPRVKPGYIVADLGAFIGLYTVALAKRVGDSGKVFAFEPDPQSFALLKTLVSLNNVSERVELVEAAVGAQDGFVPFKFSGFPISCVCLTQADDTVMVKCVRLDTIFLDTHIDILKIDVEGYEEKVLEGGVELLSDSRRSPKLIYVEMHPFLWPKVGTSSASIIGLLNKFGYQVFDFQGQSVKRIGEECCAIVACRDS